MATGEALIITGSSGMIGSALIERLAGDYRIAGLDAKEPPEGAAEHEYVFTDLTKDASVEQAVDVVRTKFGADIASVIHLAAYYNFSGGRSELYEQITVQGTERLLRALAPLHVEQIVFSSTMLVHAPTVPGKPIWEDSPLEGKWEYPQSKIETERIVRERRGNAKALLLRIAGVYRDDCMSVPLSHQIQRIHEKWMTAYVFPGDITHGQTFVHMDDVVEAFRLAVERRNDLPDEQALLIGEPETLSYDSLQREFARLLHGDDDWTTREIPKTIAELGAWVQEHAPGEDPFIKPWMVGLADDHYELDISRAEKLLGWRPRRALRDALPTMIEDFRRDPAAWYRKHKIEPPEDAA